MTIYDFENYREAISSYVERMRKLPGGATLAEIASDIGVQPSYMTNVLKGRADFSRDQVFAFAQKLELSSPETAYLLLLLDHERSGLKKRKEALALEIRKIRKAQMQTEKHLQTEKSTRQDEAVAQYYLNPLCQVVHVHLNFKQYAKKPELLAPLLGVSMDELRTCIALLEKIEFIKFEAGGYKVVQGNRHLPSTSPYCRPHQTLMRYKSLDQMHRLKEGSKYSFSVTFSASAKDRDLIQKAFLEFTQKAEKIVSQTEREKVYQINFDLFPWAVDSES